MHNQIFRNIINMLAVVVLAATGFSQGASGQISGNRLPAPQSEVYDIISATEVIAMLDGIAISAEITRPSGQTRASLRAQTPNGGRFYIHFLGCQDDANLVGCSGIQYRAGMSNAGISYGDINSFNASSIITKAVNVAELDLVSFTRAAIIRGGVGKRQLQLQTALFLRDLDDYVKDYLNTASASHQGEGAIAARAKIDRVQGPLSSDLDASHSDASHLDAAFVDHTLVDSAIFNTWSVRFLTIEAKALLDQHEGK